jgi:RIO-like serine/threonine protein kinase
MHTESKIAHNDLFKRNIMLDEDGNLFVIDFGKAKLHEIDNPMRDMQFESDRARIDGEIRSFFGDIDKLDI